MICFLLFIYLYISIKSKTQKGHPLLSLEEALFWSCPPYFPLSLSILAGTNLTMLLLLFFSEKSPKSSLLSLLSVLLFLSRRLPCFCSGCPAWRKAPPLRYSQLPQISLSCPLPFFLSLFLVFSRKPTILCYTSHLPPPRAAHSKAVREAAKKKKKNHHPQKAQLLGWGVYKGILVSSHFIFFSSIIRLLWTKY